MTLRICRYCHKQGRSFSVADAPPGAVVLGLWFLAIEAFRDLGEWAVQHAMARDRLMA